MLHISNFLKKHKQITEIDETVPFGKRISEKELLDVFAPRAQDGEVNLYYGQIGNGKTAGATADVLDLLRKGQVVYVNWRINYDGFDETKSLRTLFWKTIFFKSVFFSYPKENLIYFSPDDVDMEFLAKLTDCHVYIDEGQWIFDSYKGTHFDPVSRRLILHTRHFNRSLNIVSQRTQAIHVSARAQVNRFYKFVKVWSYPFIIIKRKEYQDLKGQDVDEEVEPVSVKSYFLSKRIKNAYNSKYMRDGVPMSQEVHFEGFKLNFGSRIKALLTALGHLTDGFKTSGKGLKRLDN